MPWPARYCRFYAFVNLIFSSMTPIKQATITQFRKSNSAYHHGLEMRSLPATPLCSALTWTMSRPKLFLPRVSGARLSIIGTASFSIAPYEHNIFCPSFVLLTIDDMCWVREMTLERVVGRFPPTSTIGRLTGGRHLRQRKALALWSLGERRAFWSQTSHHSGT
jgi:hypothetical protein